MDPNRGIRPLTLGGYFELPGSLFSWNDDVSSSVSFSFSPRPWSWWNPPEYYGLVWGICSDPGSKELPRPDGASPLRVVVPV